ncbi:MAG: septal ring lytic transglycosylase RlpA family protein [Saprospiraceae bacterium]
MKSTFKFLLFNLFLTTSLLAQDDEFGIGSYYSDLFQGKPTASGELYDKDKLTAAHKTLPFGTLVKVTRLDNDKSVTVRVNDRGPFISGRIIELSREGANRIDLIKDGATRVKVEIVKEQPAPTDLAEATKPVVPTPAEQPEAKIEKKEEPKPAAPKTNEVAAATTAEKGKVKINEKPSNTIAAVATPKTEKKTTSNSVLVKSQDYTPLGLYEIELKRPEAKGFGVQVAALTSQNALFKKIAELQGEWFDNILVNVEQGKGDEMVYKVILGSFASQGEAKVYQDNLKKNKKIKGFVVDLASFAPAK